MKKTINLFWLFLYFVTAREQIFEPSVILDTPNPMVGDNISVGLFTIFSHPCLILPTQNLQGDTHLFEFSNHLLIYEEKHIDLIVNTLTQPTWNPFPVSPVQVGYYAVGTLKERKNYLQNGLIGRFNTLLHQSI